MRFTLFLSLLISFSFLNSQESKKLLKLLNGDFVQVEGSTDYQSNIPKDAKIHFYYYANETTPDQYFKDTNGVSNSTEFLRYQTPYFLKGKESFKLIKKDWVTNGEYWEFIEFVEDSIIRDYIYLKDEWGVLDHEEAFNLLKFEPKWIEDEYVEGEVNFIERKRNRELFSFDYSFDWRKKLGLRRCLPIIDRLYLPDYEEYEKEGAIDFRKIIYKWEYISRDTVINYSQVQVYPDQTVWSKNSKHPYDLHHYMSEHMFDQGYYFPVQGINGKQVEAYLSYLRTKLQNEINEKKLNYWVVISLPDKEELNQAKICKECPKYVFEVEEFDHAEHWKIKNADYHNFMTWVKDSIVRERIFFSKEQDDIDDKIDQLAYENEFFDRANTVWNVYDPSMLIENRDVFRFNYEYDWRKKLSADKLQSIIGNLFKEEFIIDGQVNFDLFDPKKVVYHFSWKDYKAMSKEPEPKYVSVYDGPSQFEPSRFDFKPRQKNMLTDFGVWSWEDLSQFHIGEYINVTPGIDCKECNLFCYEKHGDNLSAGALDSICGKCIDVHSQQPTEIDYQNYPEELVQGLTYDQAIAFYHWSYIRGNRQPKKWDTRLEVFPSEEQFKKVQNGESVEIETREIPYPTPLFRYVVHVYPKND